MDTKTPHGSLRTVTAADVVVRRRPRAFQTLDYVVIAASGASSFALTWLLYAQLLPFSGIQGFVLLWFASFVAIYYIAVRETEGTVVARDHVMAAVIGIIAIAVIVPLLLILGYVTIKGLRYLRIAFFTTTGASIGPRTPATQTGGLQAIVGSLEQVGLAMIISVPLGILTAVYLNEVRGRLVRPTRIFVDAMSGVPSIIAGLFIYILIVSRGGSFSGFAAALALSILMLPTVTRTAEVVLRLVPDGLREAALAMGVPEWRMILGVVLPTARTGIITAVILGVARVVGETAPLIMTAFGASTLNLNPFSGPQAALPLSTLRLFQSSQPADVARAWVYAFVLISIVLVLFVTARRMARRWRD